MQIRERELAERAVGRLETWQALVGRRNSGNRREAICAALDNVGIHAMPLTMLVYAKERLDAGKRLASIGVYNHINWHTGEPVRGTKEQAQRSGIKRGTARRCAVTDDPGM